MPPARRCARAPAAASITEVGREERRIMFGTTRTLFAVMGGILAGALLSPAPAAAQQSKTVTGCLAAGSTAGSYAITDADGHDYMLHSGKVKLQGHVGHKVTVKGTTSAMAHDDGMAMAKDTGMAMAHDSGMAMTKDDGMAKHDDMDKHDGMAKEGGEMAGQAMLTVSELTMVSATCQ
jgi:hypothetical protein